MLRRPEFGPRVNANFKLNNQTCETAEGQCVDNFLELDETVINMTVIPITSPIRKEQIPVICGTKDSVDRHFHQGAFGAFGAFNMRRSRYACLGTGASSAPVGRVHV